MPPPNILPYTCWRCLRATPHPRPPFFHRRNRNLSTLPPPKPPPALPPPKAHAPLPHRRLLYLSGPDAPRFLQGLTTNSIPPYPTSAPRPGSKPTRSAFYSGFLNASGRVLYDVFIYPVWRDPKILEEENGGEEEEEEEPGFMIEVDGGEVQGLERYLKKYLLRRKVRMRVVGEGEWGVWSVWGAEGNLGVLPGGGFGGKDERDLSQMWRVLLPGGERPVGDVGEEVGVDVYHLRRFMSGVPEGQGEIWKEAALPLECNMDLMGGIDFRKGCYVGQELTIRTHHTGVVRKRVLPVRVYGVEEERGKEKEKGKGGVGLVYERDWKGGLPPLGANIERVGRKGRSAGKWIGGMGNVGLALCRLELMTGTVLTGEGSQWSPEDEFKVVWEGGEVKVEAFVPSWHEQQAAIARDSLARGRDDRHS